MSKRKQNVNALKKENIISSLRIFLVAALMVIIFYPPYLQGLFFEKHVLPTQVIVFIVFIIFLIYKWLKNDYSFFKTPIEYVSFGFVVVYFISIFVAVHTRSAIIEWLKYCMYFAVFYMVSDLAENLKIKLLFLWTIVISGVGVSIIGLDAALGGNLVGILNKFFSLLGVQGNLFFGLFEGNRIHSTLQYPNALASYLMAVFFVTIGLFMVYNQWWQKIILGSLSFILFTTFMLTQSRGAQLLFPVAVIILLIASPKYNRVKAVTYVLLLAAPAGVISLFLYSYLSTDSLSPKALLLSLLGLLLTILISLAIQSIGNNLQKVNWRVYIAIVSSLIVISAVGVNYIVNQSMPIELSHELTGENRTVSISKDVVLKPGKEYILEFDAEGKLEEEKPYIYYVRINSKNLNNILFGGSTQILRVNFMETDSGNKNSINFFTTDDAKLVNISFSIYHAGTSVKINNTNIIDAETGKIVKKIMLKNKYNLDSIISRFQNIGLQRSLVSRVIFYKDGLNMFKNKWFLGAGGGAWNYLYRQYQSYNYASSQAHNYPLQLGIETGILGIVVLISLVLILVNSYIKYYSNNNSIESWKEEANVRSGLLYALIITAIASLFMHSVIDFDFSESSMLLLFWQLIALFNREMVDSLVTADLNLLNTKVNAKRGKYAIDKKRKSTILIGICISTVTLYFSSTFFIASSFARQSFESLQNNDFEKAINKMEKAISLDRYNEKYILGHNPIPNRPDIKAGLTDILFMKNEIYRRAQYDGENISEADLSLFQNQFSKAALYINKIENKAENNLSLTTDLASFYFKTGEIDKGLIYLNSAISYFPFEPSLWHSKVDIYYQLMGINFNNRDYEKAEEFLFKGLNVINEAKEINKNNMNSFVFNQNSVELLQKMKFIKDNWNNDEINDVNDVIHYSMFDLDINMDGVPDQWRVSNTELMNVSIDEDDLHIQTSGSAYLYTRFPIKFKKGNTYRVEIQLKNSVDSVSFIIPGITEKAISFIHEDNKYVAELLVEKEPSENGNQIRIYVEDDTVIKNILIKEIGSNY